MLKEAREKEEKFFIHKFRNLMECNGHYIYYEKNNEMQDYMISSRKNNGITPSEVIEDTAIKNFRSVIRDKMEKKEKKENSRFVYAVSVGLVLIMLVVGVTKVNDFERMSSLKGVMGSIIGESDTEKENEGEEDIPVIGEVEAVVDPIVDPVEDPVVDPIEPEKPDVEPEGPYKDGVHVVEKGDTLAIISRKVYGDLDHIDAICRMNGLKNGNLILVGQKLLLP